MLENTCCNLNFESSKYYELRTNSLFWWPVSVSDDGGGEFPERSRQNLFTLSFLDFCPFPSFFLVDDFYLINEYFGSLIFNQFWERVFGVEVENWNVFPRCSSILCPFLSVSVLFQLVRNLENSHDLMSHY